MYIQDSTIFQQLKPRLQRMILDHMFQPFYKIFEITFKDCETNFRRKIIMKSKLDFSYSSENIVRMTASKIWPQQEVMPQIIKFGEKSDRVYFLMSGLIHIMDKNGLYEYGIIHEGSYFGDISVIFDEPNEYSYCFNPFSGRSV